ncbi:hypothetical protein L596_015692 [Steinernema carpocapsae]|uniref:Uncharacterized protein n=1 Tax=Steinernema carpocapsae TaxID=34508 RepID=A0A4U5NGQ1_STECR|nr:hypothetical protein L596_015692 [Steinernema carpocapsae]
MAYRRRKPSISSSQKPAKLFRRVEEIIWRNKHFMLHLDTFIDPNLLQRMTHLLEMYISRTNGQSLKASLAKKFVIQSFKGPYLDHISDDLFGVAVASVSAYLKLTVVDDHLYICPPTVPATYFVPLEENFWTTIFDGLSGA